MVGSGGLVVMNQGTCMVSIARFFMEFTQRESCGKCVLCREGTKQLLALLDDVIEGRADQNTLDLLDKLGRAVQIGSLVRTGKDSAESGALDDALLPQGIRGARLREALPDRPVQGAFES
jgi:NADH:ubiquinone oxidoreductase subunit F (NADH-binding)